MPSGVDLLVTNVVAICAPVIKSCAGLYTSPFIPTADEIVSGRSTSSSSSSPGEGRGKPLLGFAEVIAGGESSSVGRPAGAPAAIDRMCEESFRVFAFCTLL